MGANSFDVQGKGRSADVVFRRLVEDARHEHGHGGYTGSIAEKHDFVVIAAPSEDVRKQIHANMVNRVNRGIEWQKSRPPSEYQQKELAGAEARLATLLATDPSRIPNIMEEYATFLMNVNDARVSDKWGPAGCVCIKEPQPIKPLSKAAATKLAVERHGPTVSATLYVVRTHCSPGVNEPVPGGYRNAVGFAHNAADADAARGMLFAEDGEWMFFGWASS
jgi:hypothetical protein